MDNSLYFEAQQVFYIKQFIRRSADLIRKQFGNLKTSKFQADKAIHRIIVDWLIYIISIKRTHNGVILDDVNPKTGAREYYMMKNDLKWHYGNIDETTFDKFYSNIRRNLFTTNKNIKRELERSSELNVLTKVYKGNVNFTLKYKSKSRPITLYEKLPIETYDRMKSRLSGFSNSEADNLIFAVVHRYNIFMESKEGHSLVAKEVQQDLDPSTTLEMFASAVNASFDNFCSLFPDLEKHFGSIGSALTIPVKTLTQFKHIMANPPYINSVMEDMADKLIKISKHGYKIGITITIPDWRPTRNRLEPYPTYSRLEPYIKSKVEKSGTYKYYNSFNDNYINIRTGTLILKL